MITKSRNKRIKKAKTKIKKDKEKPKAPAEPPLVDENCAGCGVLVPKIEKHYCLHCNIYWCNRCGPATHCPTCAKEVNSDASIW